MAEILQIVSGADEIAGVQRHAAWLARNSRHRHHIATTPAPKYESWLREQGLEPLVFRNPAEFLRLAKSIRPRILHAHLGQALIAGFTYKMLHPATRLIYSQHILYPRSTTDRGLAAAVRRTVLNQAYRRTDCIIAVSRAVADETRRRGEGHRVEVIYNGVPSRTGPVRDFRADRLNVIGISRMQPEKRPADFIAVAAALDDPRISIRVYGTGDLLDEVRSLAGTVTSRTKLEFMGFRTDIEAALAEADIFLHFGEEEACPLAVLEAMTWGLPVVTLGLGGNIELVPEGTGRLFARGDTAGMARYLVELLENPGARAAMSTAAAQWSAGFTMNRMINDIDRLYDELAGN